MQHRLYRTTREDVISIDTLSKPCRVVHSSGLQGKALSAITDNPDAFYVAHSFDGEHATSIDDLDRLSSRNLRICDICTKGHDDEHDEHQMFKKNRPLKMMDVVCLMFSLSAPSYFNLYHSAVPVAVLVKHSRRLDLQRPVGE